MVTASSTQLDFPLFKVVNDARSTYGLRHQDFGRYQSHCTTKLAHLRKAAGLTQIAGKAKKYARKDVTPTNASSEKHLLILLFASERAWAHSQLLKSTLSLPSTSPQTAHRLAKRLSRALVHAAQLQALVSDPAVSSRLSVSQRGQVAAYFLVMKGSLSFERAKHEEGLKALGVAWELLGKLAETAESAGDEALTNEVIDEVEPMLRFCAYSLQKDTSRGMGEVAREVTGAEGPKEVQGWEELLAELEASGGREKRETIELSWRGREIPVRNVELVAVVAKVTAALKTLENDADAGKEGKERKKGARKVIMGAKRMAAYDRALLVLSEGEEVARQLVEDNKIALSRVQSPRFEASSAPLQLAHSYLIYQHLSIRTKRDLLIIEDSKAKLAAREVKIAEAEADYLAKTGSKDPKAAANKVRKHRAKVYPSLVKLYENIIQSLEQMRDLEVVEQDGELAATVEARIAFVRAWRSLFLSRTYALVDKFPASLSLNSRAKLYARESRSAALSLEADDDPSLSLDHDFIAELVPLSNSSFDALDLELSADVDRTSKEWYAATGGLVGDVEPEDLRVEQLSLADAGAEKKRKKPAFYDVAFNYVAAFDLEAIARRAAGEEEEVREVQEDVEMDEVVEAGKPAAPAKSATVEATRRGRRTSVRSTRSPAISWLSLLLPTSSTCSTQINSIYNHAPQPLAPGLSPTPRSNMGSSTSTPVPLTDKSSYSARPRDPSAADWLAALSIRSTGKATAAVSTSSLKDWETAVESDPTHRLAAVLLHKADFTQALVSRKTVVADTQVFNVKLSSESTTVSNQKSSGRCWLFATTNIIRLAMARKYGLEGFELSQSYLFFYDSLEKANYHLENMLDLADEPLDSREVQFLLSTPENDGGQWDMAVNLIEKYGLVPQSIFPESANSSATAKLDSLLTSKLREYTIELRGLHAAAMRSLAEVEGKSYSQKKIIAEQSARKRKEEQMEEIYRILAITLGTPPKPTDKFVWEYYSKDKKTFHTITATPLEFYKTYSTADVSAQISLINDPRNAYETLYTVQRLGNVWGGRPVLYVNTAVQNLKDVAIALLKADIPVWFGCDVGKSSNSALGIMDTKLYDLEGAFGTHIGLSKAERLATGDSAMTHAMVLTAVHLDAAGKSVRWRVENSWGDAACDHGFMLMSDDWFSEHVFQIVADRKRVPAHLVKVFEHGTAVELPPWDPMGSLA